MNKKSEILSTKLLDAISVSTIDNPEVAKSLSKVANVAVGNIDNDGRVFLGNAFSLQMVAAKAALVSMVEVEIEEIPKDAISCVGHADTARILSSLIGREIAFNRTNVKLNVGDTLYVAQLTGGRLPEGATSLPEGFAFKFVKVIVTVAT